MSSDSAMTLRGNRKAYISSQPSYVHSSDTTRIVSSSLHAMSSCCCFWKYQRKIWVGVSNSYSSILSNLLNRIFKQIARSFGIFLDFKVSAKSCDKRILTYVDTCCKCGSSGSRGGRGGHAPPGPVKIGHKKDGRQRWPHRFHVSSAPPLTRPLDPLLVWINVID